MIEIFLATETKVDWQTVLKVSTQGLGRNITASVDARRIPCNSLKAFLMCLGEFYGPNSDPIRHAREAGMALRQISIGIMVATSTEFLYEIAVGGSGLAILEADHDRPYTVALISGNLENWRNTIINGCAIGASYALRLFCNKVVAQFDKMDLGIIFDNYARRTQQDQTFALALK
jgi:hypothetical protein